MTAFEEMGVLPEIAKAVEEMDWTLPTDVQAEAIPLILGGGDVLMAAETGSGKTGAFCLPIVQTVWETLKALKEGSSKGTVLSTSIGSTKWVLSTHDRGSAFAVTPDGLRCQSREQKEWHGCRASKGVYGKGKFYFTTTVADEGLCRVGWSTQQAILDLGTDRFSFGFGGTGKKSHNKNFEDYGEAFGKNDVITACLDLDQFKIFFMKNGINLGEAFSIPSSLRNEVFYPAVVLKNAEMQFNFGDEKFKYDPPPGFLPISEAPVDNVKVNSNGRNIERKPVKILANAPQAIIMEPSRELAEQTYNQLRKFRQHLNSPTVRELLLVGGVPVRNQIAELQQGVDIVVATPGRLDDLIASGELILSQCRFFVLDEADGLLKDRSYGALIYRMHQQIPKMNSEGIRLQMIVCSATLHDFEVKKLADKLMHFPTWVDLKGEDSVPETVHHVVVPVDPRIDISYQTLLTRIITDGVHYDDMANSHAVTPETLSEGTKLLKGEYCIRAIDSLQMDQAIIFCRTKLDCDNMEKYLNSRGRLGSNTKNPYTCVCLHADRSPTERKENLETFKRKAVKFLICTDVAARGIDVSGVPFMINVTLPDEKSSYVHRIGRVGRAERMGLAISFVSTVPEKVWYHGCPSKGKNCYNTNLTSQKGCCIWYNEMQYLADIEDHLGVTIQQIGTDIDVPSDEFDGKVVYGQKRKELQSGIEYHLNQTATALAELSALETQAQTLYLNRYFIKNNPQRTN